MALLNAWHLPRALVLAVALETLPGAAPAPPPTWG
jgi:hypothetical protein